MNKEVSVIILNFNSNEYTLNCISSILKHTSKDINYRIIVVDNGSNKDHFDKLKLDLNNFLVTLIRSEVNLGYSGGLQVGVNYSNSDYYFFLNNDCLFLNNVIAELLNFYSKEEKAGVVGGQIFDQNKVASKSFNYQPTLLLKLFGHQLLKLVGTGTFPNRKKKHKNPLKVPVISGCAMFISKEVFEEIGGLDVNYFLYCEEEDLALRANRFNYNNFIVPAAKYVHFQGKSSVEVSSKILEHQITSLKYFYTKNYSALYQKMIFRLMLSIHLFKAVRKKANNLILAKLIFNSSKIKIEDIIRKGLDRKIAIDRAIKIY